MKTARDPVPRRREKSVCEADPTAGTPVPEARRSRPEDQTGFTAGGLKEVAYEMAGSAAEVRLTDPERIWDEAATRLRAEIGEGPFSS